MAGRTVLTLYAVHAARPEADGGRGGKSGGAMDTSRPDDHDRDTDEDAEAPGTAHPATGASRRSWRNRSPALRGTGGAALTADRAGRWRDLQEVSLDLSQRKLRKERLVAIDRRDAHLSGSFDMLRTRLITALKANGWRRVAITSPTAGCGKTFCAINLAISLSRLQAVRTVLLDLDLRAPGIAGALGLQPTAPMSDLLTGARDMHAHLVRIGGNLALGLNDTPIPDSAETLQAPQTARALKAMQLDLRPDVVLYELPPALGHDDLFAFLPQIDAVLLIADGTHTTAEDISACERILSDRTPLLGVVLNKADDPDSRRHAKRGS